MALQTLEKETLITFPGYGEVYSRVLFRNYNWIVENWLPRRPALKQRLGEKIDFPLGTTSLTPAEVAYLWHVVGKKEANYADLHQEMKEYAIRTGAIGIMNDSKNLVHSNNFNPKQLPVIIQSPRIEASNSTYAEDLDKRIEKAIKDGRNPTLDDLVETNAKFVGGKILQIPEELIENFGKDIFVNVPFLGINKQTFPSGIRPYVDRDVDYTSVGWGLCPADERSSDLGLDARLEDSDSLWGSLQGRRSADSIDFYRGQLEEVLLKINNAKKALE